MVYTKLSKKNHEFCTYQPAACTGLAAVVADAALRAFNLFVRRRAADSADYGVCNTAPTRVRTMRTSRSKSGCSTQ